MSADGARLYNASIGDMTIPLAERDNVAEASDNAGFAYQVMVVDPVSLTVLERHRFEKGIRPIAIAADESLLYAQQSNQHWVIAYDLKAKAEVDKLELPVKEGVTEGDYDFEAPHHGLALSPDGKTLCVAARASDYVGLVGTEPSVNVMLLELPPGTSEDEAKKVLDARLEELTRLPVKKLELISTVPAGDAPGWAEITEDGAYCLAANTRSDDVSVVSIADRAEVARVKAGRAPKHISVARVPVGVLEGVGDD